jgi:hypothetical protein
MPPTTYYKNFKHTWKIEKYNDRTPKLLKGSTFSQHLASFIFLIHFCYTNLKSILISCCFMMFHFCRHLSRRLLHKYNTTVTIHNINSSLI